MAELITPEYVEEQRWLHETGTRAYGTRGYNWAYLAAGIAAIEGCHSVLDYGCGKGTLGKALRTVPVRFQGYDPAVLEFAALPRPADLVVCADVLEHVEPPLLDNVLDHIAEMTHKLLFAVISNLTGKRVLRDKSPAHLIVEGGDWWQPKFEARGLAVRRVWEADDEWIALMSKRS